MTLFPRLLLAASLCAAALIAPVAVASDNYVQRLNAAYRNIPQAQRSDLVVLPAVAAMDPLPRETPRVDDLIQIILTLPGMSGWDELQTWAMAEPQRAALEAVARATEDEGSRTMMVFAQPYGAEDVSIEMIQAELYTELGDPPILAAADIMYLSRLDKLIVLLHIEANRLYGENKPAEALDVLMQTLSLGRQLADRQLPAEQTFGMTVMFFAFGHMRDIAYLDFRSGTPRLTPDELTEVVRRIGERSGPVGIERMALPQGSRVAGEQLLFRIFNERSGRPDPDRFAPTLARIYAQSRPLRLFSETARWAALEASQANLSSTQAMLNRIGNDFQTRWSLRSGDPMLLTRTEYERLVADSPEYAALDAAFRRFPLIFRMRQSLRTEAAGTRMSLGMYAFWLRNRSFPQVLSAIRPTFAPAIDEDPYSTARTPIQFFVPIRDQPRGAGGREVPHSIRVFPSYGDFRPFEARVGSDQFVIYSTGPDQVRGFASDSTQARPGFRRGDYLLWPPELSLLRQFLVDDGQLR